MSTLSVYSTSLLVLVVFYVLLRRTTKGRRLPPGPTPWPVVGNLPHLGPVVHQSMAALASKHGPLMYLRLGKLDMIVVSSASVAAQFLKLHDINFCNRPSTVVIKQITYNCQDLGFCPYGPRWRLLRKLTNTHLFCNKAMEDFKHIREGEVKLMTKELESARKMAAPVKFLKLLTVCSANTLTQAMLGRRLFGSGDDPMGTEFKSMLAEMSMLSGKFNIGDYIPMLENLDLQGVGKKVKKLHKRFDAFLSRIVKDQLHKGKEEDNCLLSTLLSLRDEPSDEQDDLSLTDDNIKSLLTNLFIGGADSPSNTVEWGIAELIKSPTVRVRVQEEIDAVVGREKLVRESDLVNLPYFQAVTKEVLRLHPPSPLSLPRQAAENCEINGYHIPQGATVFFNLWAIARNEGSWAEPLEFRPERFMPGGEKPDIDVEGNDFELIPFGAGRRICPGVILGLRMIQLMFATLIHGYDWEMANGESPDGLNMEDAYGLAVRRAVPLMLNPKPRLAQMAYL